MGTFYLFAAQPWWVNLLVFVPIAILLNLLHGDPTLVFITSALGIVPLAGLLGEATDALAKKAFHHLEGVTDEWLKTVKVEKVPGGQVDPNEDIRLYAALLQRDTQDSCCRRKMFDQPDQEAPNLADPDAPCLDKGMIASEK